MLLQPPYFERVRLAAARRWDQLEQDKELAGPWHQLFKQVQSPKHVLSELLQNANDAGATEARAWVDGDLFTFEHNGEDFTEEHFTSLCRFGYSNKRALQTIGFRGIGFKSTFSLGDIVELYTPSLAIRFHKSRFTEPIWSEHVDSSQTKTRIQVRISDKNRQLDIERNLQDWLRSPVSLLFFQNIRCLSINNTPIEWREIAAGPVPGSQWLALNNNNDSEYLLIRSQPEDFPEDAITEIRQERMLDEDESSSFPACRVELVLGAKGRLYVVLPTGVETDLPFACNAPFIQDPARMEIKDPAVSPTNRWLLQRAGRLAAESLIHWLHNKENPEDSRVSAYDLLPNSMASSATLATDCANIIQASSKDIIRSQDILLDMHGNITSTELCRAAPTITLEIWDPDNLSRLLSLSNTTYLHPNISSQNVQKLIHWKLVQSIDKENILSALKTNTPSKPKTWKKLLLLWNYLAKDILGYDRYRSQPAKLKIFPVKNSSILYTANSVIRLGSSKKELQEEDWDFLEKYVNKLDPEWLSFLQSELNSEAAKNDQRLERDIRNANGILEELNLGTASNASKLLDNVANSLANKTEAPSLETARRVAHIAAALNADVGQKFYYYTADNQFTSAIENIYYDKHGILREILTDKQTKYGLLHECYSQSFVSCNAQQWDDWASSSRSKLKTFIPLVESRKFIGKRAQLDEELQARGYTEAYETHYKGESEFAIEDWDFPAESLTYWSEINNDNSGRIWQNVAILILRERPDYWRRCLAARIQEFSRNGNSRTVVTNNLTPTWIIRLRQHACLPSTQESYERPEDLLRRTPETDAQWGVEPFLNSRFDTEANRPLLNALGVRSSFTDPRPILTQLRILASIPDPPREHLDKYYIRLDKMYVHCGSEERQELRDAFYTERLIFSDQETWETSSSIFRTAAEDDVPGAPVLRASVQSLPFWQALGVPERPTADLAIAWLQTLERDKALPRDVSRRIRRLQEYHALRIWQECGYWLNLQDRLVPVEDLTYSLTSSGQIHWRHLDPWVKAKTANLRGINSDILAGSPFSSLALLADVIEERFAKDLNPINPPVVKNWLQVFSNCLQRIILDDIDETARIRSLGEQLRNTTWNEVSEIEILPYIQGTPAGTARQVDLIWKDGELYLTPMSSAKLARRVPEELGNSLNSTELRLALAYCFNRTSLEINEYLAENFSLAEPTEALPVTAVLVDYRTESSESVLGSIHKQITGDLQNTNPPFRETYYSHKMCDSSALQTIIHSSEAVKDNISLPTRERQTRSKPETQNIVDQFARRHGFLPDDQGNYQHPEGGQIIRLNQAVFPWMLISPSGETIRYYRAYAHCLAEKPLEVAAEVWSLCSLQPNEHSLLLLTPEGAAVEITGEQLQEMKDQGELELYPASYRLVHKGI